MIGPRTGLRVGVRPGLAAGLGADPIAVSNASMAGVAQDATALKYVPATNGQWTTTMAAASIASGNPSSAWLCQEASGNLADSIGAQALTAFGGPAYAQAFPGFTRQCVSFQVASNTFFNTSLGAISTTSALVLVYAAFSATPTTAKNLINLGSSGTNSRHAQVTVTTPKYQLVGDNAQATGTGASNIGTQVRPVILQVDRTNSKMQVITDQEVIAPAYTAPSGAGTYLSLGPDSVGDATTVVSIGYAAYFSGAAAEMSNAQIRKLLQTLGWTVAW